MLKTYAAHQPTTKKQKKSTNLMHFQPTKKVFVQLIFPIFFEFCGKTFFFCGNCAFGCLQCDKTTNFHLKIGETMINCG